jgi:hypothetical protein
MTDEIANAADFFPFPWITPDTPDLGCFVKHEHDLEIDPSAANIHFEMSPLVGGKFAAHQIYFRVQCGHASFFQRCTIYKRNFFDPPNPGDMPDYVLGGDFQPRPSNWAKFPVRNGLGVYFFMGQRRDPATPNWMADAAVGHSFDTYDNGTLSTVRYDDTGGDRDFDDLILEVAVVRRRTFLFKEANDQPSIHAKLTKDWLPRIRQRIPEAAKDQ